MKIKKIQSLEILDSRGNPTIRTVLTLTDGSTHFSSVPSGESTGSYEAIELRDNDSNRYGGKGVLKTVKNVNTVIAKAVVGMEADPKTVDSKLLELDGTKNKENLGANAILSVSIAVCRAAAHAENKPLWQFLNWYYFNGLEGSLLVKASFPQLMVNIINGGRHASWNFDIQEFMIVPNSTTPSKSIRISAEIFHSLGNVLKEKGLSTLLGDEGGYSPKLNSNEEVLNIIIEAGKLAGYENLKDFRLSLDCAANEWFENGNYFSHKQNELQTADQLLSYYQLLTKNYQLLSIEDAFSEDDWEAWKKLTEHSSVILSENEGSQDSSANQIDPINRGQNDNLIIVGDDLFCTNPERIKRGIEKKTANAVLIKVNQIGTVTETVEAINITHKAGWKTAISHRSGETEDNFIADLAYSCASEFLKTGSMSRSERLSKYNRLLEIERGI